MFFGPNSAGVCPADSAPHDPSQSGAYVMTDLTQTVVYDGPTVDERANGYGDRQWRRCRKCAGLVSGTTRTGTCPADHGAHDPSGSDIYVLAFAGSALENADDAYQASWRQCAACLALCFIGNGLPGACTARANGHLVEPGGNAYYMSVAGPLDDGEQHRLLVVAPASLMSSLAPLIAHKNSTGMSAVALELTTVTAHYAGRDDAERLKRAITQAFEYSGTRYILLVGDASVMPTRFRFIRYADGWRTGAFAPTDLYYANLYRQHVLRAAAPVRHGAWSDWDADGDGCFNTQDWANNALTINPDEVDGFCDIAVGRLPVRTPTEVDAYVAKLIAYETGIRSQASSSITLVLDANYQASPLLAEQVVTDVPLQGSTWPGRQTVGFNFAPSQARPPSVELAGVDTLGAITGRSAWVLYIGHGWSGGWDIAGSEAGDVAAMADDGNAAVVYAAGCNTGQLTIFAPDGPDRYTAVDGSEHWFWQLPAGSDTPDRTVDFGANDAAGGNGTPVQTWARATDGVIPPITPPIPAVYQDACYTVAKQWLTHPSAGAVVYFGEQTTAPDNDGCLLATAVLGAQSAPGGAPDIIGDLWAAGCRGYFDQFGANENCIDSARIYLSYMTLYGDPSLRVQTVNRPSPVWPAMTDWTAANGSIVTTPVIGTNRSGRLEVIGQGLDSGAWHTWQDAANGPWDAGWQPLGTGTTISGRPSVVRNVDGRLEVFARSTDGSVVHVWQPSPDTEWGTWDGLGGGSGSVPVAAANADGHLEVFIIADDPSGRPRLQHRWWTAVGWWPTADSWADLANPAAAPALVGAPAVGRNADGRLEVFARSDDGGIWHVWQNAPNGLWTDWGRMGQDGDVLDGPPSVATTADGRLDVLARGEDGRIWNITELPGSGWSPWTGIDCAILTGSDVAVVLAPAGLTAFAIGPLGDLVWIQQTSTPAQWTPKGSLGGRFTGAVAAAVDADGCLEVFAIGADQSVWRRKELTPGGAWSS